MQIKVSEKFQNQDFKLCYVDGNNTAWFTTQPITGPNRQCGDDWDDSPYEHNAGEPYCEKEDELVRIGVEGFRTPADTGLSCSVEEINAGLVAWLFREVSYVDDSNLCQTNFYPIHSGTDFASFLDKVKQAGGEVLIPLKYIQD